MGRGEKGKGWVVDSTAVGGFTPGSAGSHVRTDRQTDRHTDKQYIRQFHSVV